MVEEATKIKLQCQYDGANTTKNGITTLKFRCPFSEITSYINVVRCIGLNLKVGIVVENTKHLLTPQARFKNIRIDREGEAIVQIEAEIVNYASIINACDKIIKVYITEV